MELWKELFNIKFKDKKFKILINKNFQKYYLKILDDGSFSYPTFDEFKLLYYTFSKYSYDVLLSSDTLLLTKNNTRKKSYLLSPKVIVDKGKKAALVSLTVALLSITGCQDKHLDIMEQYAAEENITISDWKKLGGYDVRLITSMQISDQKIDRVCESLDDFKEQVENPNPSWEEIYDIIDENDKLSDEHKIKLKNGVSNLEEKMPNMDLAILYENLKRATIIKESAVNSNYAATFSVSSGKCSITPESTDYDLFHELLGHGAFRIITKGKDGKTVYFDNSGISYLTSNEKEDSIDGGMYGLSMGEAIATIIGKIAAREPIDYTDGYFFQVSVFQTLLKTNNLTPEDFTRIGISGLTKEIEKNCTEYQSAFSVINTMDIVTSAAAGQMELADIYEPTKILFGYLLSYEENLIQSGKSEDEIKKFIDDSINQEEWVGYDQNNPLLIAVEPAEDCAAAIVDYRSLETSLMNYYLDSVAKGTDFCTK